VNSCVVQWLVCGCHAQQRDRAAAGGYSLKPLHWKPVKTTVAAGFHRTKLYTSPVHQGAAEGLRNHYYCPPRKKLCLPTLLRCTVGVLWLLAPRGIQYSAWYSKKKSCPWTRAGSRTCHPVRGRQQQIDQLCGTLEQIRWSRGEEMLKGSQIGLDIAYIPRKKPKKP